MKNNQLINLKEIHPHYNFDDHQKWTEDFENILEKMRLNSVNLNEYHRKRYYHYKGFLKYFRVPLIFLSSGNAFISIGLQSYVNQSTISIMTCLLSMICGIITSLELYLSIQSNMENELAASKDFYILAIDIFKTLNLNRENRVSNPRSYLDEKYSHYTKLIETSNLLVKHMKDALAPTPPKLFDLDGMSSPLSPFSTNKLDKINDTHDTIDSCSSDDDIEKIKKEGRSKNKSKKNTFLNMDNMRYIGSKLNLVTKPEKNNYGGQFYYDGILWYIRKDENNILYYVNERNGHSQWDDPRQVGVKYYSQNDKYENNTNIKHNKNKKITFDQDEIKDNNILENISLNIKKIDGIHKLKNQPNSGDDVSVNTNNDSDNDN